MPFKSYKTAFDLAQAVFDRYVRPRLASAMSAVFLGKLKIRLECDNSSNTYTYMKKPGVAVVHLGLRTAIAGAAFKSSSSNLRVFAAVPANEAPKAAKELQLSMEGLIYHEFGHLLITDMTGKAFEDIDPAYQWAIPLIKDFVNVCEDPKMERTLSKKFCYRFLKPIFGFLVRNIFMPQAKAYQDDGSIPSLLQYILLYLRCGPKALGGSNSKFDLLAKKGFMKKLIDAYREDDPTERCRKQIAAAIWMIDELGLKKSDYPSPVPLTGERPVIILVDKTPGGRGKQSVLQPEKPGPLPPISIAEAGDGEEDEEGEAPDADIVDMRTQKPEGEGEKGSGKSRSRSSDAEEEKEGGESESESESESDGEEDGEEESDDGAEEKGGGKSGSSGAGKGRGSGSGGSVAEDFDWDLEGEDPLDVLEIDSLANGYDPNLENALETDAMSNSNSFSFDASQEFEVIRESAIDSAYKSCVLSIGNLAKSLSDALTDLKRQSGPIELHYLSDGEDIDIDDYMDAKASQSLTLDLYRDEIPGREITDLAVSLLVDCSGSMNGERSRCAYAASIMAALACEEANVPSEIAAFSTGGVLYVKHFDQTVDETKQTIGLLCSDIQGAYSQIADSGTTGESVWLWGGTDCEGALSVLLGNLRKYDGKACKLVFIITDGDTGDPNRVGELIKGAREEGMVVIGIGIGTSEESLRKCFGHCKSFDTPSLSKLPDYVSDEIRDAMSSPSFQGY